MPVALLYSAPNENYLDHIKRCKERFNVLFPVYSATIKRVLGLNGDDNSLREWLRNMVLYHDLGKLTWEWQRRLATGKGLPAHSTLGAAYLWQILPANIKEPVSFAVAIHHTDRGLLGDNIERPDVQAILDRIIKDDGCIHWDDKAFNLDEELFPRRAREMNINDLKDMAMGMRCWARPGGLLEQHRRRLQAALVHHILKLCDISAAAERSEYKKDDKDHHGGWLMVEDIKNYVAGLTNRMPR